MKEKEDTRITVAKNLKKFREAANLTQSELAEKAGVTKSTISMYESAKRYPRDNIIDKLAKKLNLTVDKFYENTDVKDLPPLKNYVEYTEYKLPDGFKRVPMLGYAAAGKPLEDVNQDTIYYDVDDRYNVDFCITVSGNSMINAGINDGDIVFVRKMPTVPNGRIALVRIDNDKVCLKRFYKDKDKVTLVSENPDYAPMVFDESNCESVTVLGLAIFKQSLIK